MFNINYLLIIGSVCVIAVGQIAMKYAAQALVIEKGQSLLMLLRVNAFPIAVVLFALFLYLLSTFAWVYALRSVPLSIAYLFNSMAFVLVPLAGVFLFAETLPRFFIPGLLLILSGIFLVSRG